MFLKSKLLAVLVISSLSITVHSETSPYCRTYEPEKKSPIALLIQQLFMGGFTGIMAGGTLEYIKKDPYFLTTFNTPDGHSIIPFVAIIAGITYVSKLCYEESFENLIPKLCSFLLGLKGGSVAVKKALIYDWSNWSR